MTAAPVGGYLGWNEPVVVCPSCYVPMEDHPTEDCWYVDKSECAYYRRRLPGSDPRGTCSFGCVEEPDCITGGPWDHYIEVAPSAVFQAPSNTSDGEFDGLNPAAVPAHDCDPQRCSDACNVLGCWYERGVGEGPTNASTSDRGRSNG